MAKYNNFIAKSRSKFNTIGNVLQPVLSYFAVITAAWQLCKDPQL